MCKMTYSKDENIHYEPARLSCATIVMRGLLSGGAEKVATPGIPIVATAAKGAMSSAGGVIGAVLAEMMVGDAISPLDVRVYAEIIVNNQT